MSRLSRLLALAGVLCALTATITWFAADPGEKLIGARQPLPSSGNYLWMKQQSLESAKTALEKTAIWGVQRNGQPIPPPKAVAEIEAEKQVEWRTLGSALRKTERFVVVQIANKPPVPIKEGELLPDGSKLLKITPKSYTIETADGDKQTVITNL